MALPDQSETQMILEELITDWRKNQADGVNMRVRESQWVGVVVYSLTAHTMHLTEAVLCLYERDLKPAATPLIRQAIECAYTAVWVETYGAEAARALMHEQSRNALNTLAQFVRAGFEEKADAVAAVRATLDDLEPSASASGSKFFERCADLVGGDAMYATYRAASSKSHASTSIVDLYLHSVDVSATNPLGLAVSDEPDATGSAAWLGLLLAMVVHAALAWSRLDAQHSQRTRLKSIARQLGVRAEPVQTDKGFTRSNARDQAARRRRREASRKADG